MDYGPRHYIVRSGLVNLDKLPTQASQGTWYGRVPKIDTLLYSSDGILEHGDDLLVNRAWSDPSAFASSLL